MAKQITCQNIFSTVWVNKNVWFALAIQTAGVTRDQWDAASVTVRRQWLQAAWDRYVGKCSGVPTEAQKRIMYQNLDGQAKRTYPKGVNLGKIVSGVVSAVSTVATGGIGALAGAGVKALAGKNDTPRPQYLPGQTSIGGPPNPNALKAGTVTVPPKGGGISPLLVGGAVVAIVAVIFIARGR